MGISPHLVIHTALHEGPLVAPPAAPGGIPVPVEASAAVYFGVAAAAADCFSAASSRPDFLPPLRHPFWAY